MLEEYKQVCLAIPDAKDEDELERLNKRKDELLKQLDNAEPYKR